MASEAKRLASNVEGAFFVDSSCIDCATCRWMAPETFEAVNGYANVYHQPDNSEQRLQALKALISCPTASIGTSDRNGMQQAVAGLPASVNENVYHCGYHSESSFGAASYLIVRPEMGNILVDSPRFARPLVRNIEKLGGVRYMFLTHQDDVADHQKFHDHFDCERIIHDDDRWGSTRGVEMVLEGTEAIELDDEVQLVPVPGHTKGHTILHYGPYLFTGDHLAYSATREDLHAFRGACWYSWTELIASMKKTAELDFEWVLPGHGHPANFPLREMHERMNALIEWMGDR